MCAVYMLYGLFTRCMAYSDIVYNLAHKYTDGSLSFSPFTTSRVLVARVCVIDTIPNSFLSVCNNKCCLLIIILL